MSKGDKDSLKKTSLKPDVTNLNNDIIQKLDPNKLISSEIIELFSEERQLALERLVAEYEDNNGKLMNTIDKILYDQGKVYTLFNNIQREFCALFVFSKMLFQECRELYQLQSYFINKILSKNKDILELQDKLEDFRAALEGELNMKVFLSHQLQQTN